MKKLFLLANALTKLFMFGKGLTTLTLTLALLPPVAAHAQPHPEVGKPLITNYTAKEYGAHNQNWAAVQDPRGVMYFGNNQGVLEYDGVSWRLIPLANRGVVRSLAKDKQGRIYAGGKGDFGYLAADSIGRKQYVSLLPHVKPEDREFLDVWVTLDTPEGVYFSTNQKLFRWSGRKMEVWNTQTQFYMPCFVNEMLYALSGMRD